MDISNLPSYLAVDQLAAWAIYLEQIERVKPHLGKLAELVDTLTRPKRILVVEQTHGGQFHRFLRAHYELPAPVKVFNRPGPLPITAGEIHSAIAEWK